MFILITTDRATRNSTAPPLRREVTIPPPESSTGRQFSDATNADINATYNPDEGAGMEQSTNASKAAGQALIAQNKKRAASISALKQQNSDTQFFNLS